MPDEPRRELMAPAFPDDTGDADAALGAALAAHAAGATAATLAAVLAALRDARVLVPVVAVAGEVDAVTGADKTSDMAAVLVESAGGQRGLLAFTSTASLAAWDPAARPVPVTAPTAALAAVQEDAAALVVDLAGPARFVVTGPHLLGLADGRRPVATAEGLAWVAGESQEGEQSRPGE
ncbi:hypothetical protein GCM10023340_35560 [Nocardioides marinquilinus]|uniref:SseB protein N-terminal domain-containing protein n=1 Tax=Nocardioides marinquilinus TaxID=1210400 RepID=A0ABP9PWT3_9ACTN